MSDRITEVFRGKILYFQNCNKPFAFFKKTGVKEYFLYLIVFVYKYPIEALASGEMTPNEYLAASNYCLTVLEVPQKDAEKMSFDGKTFKRHDERIFSALDPLIEELISKEIDPTHTFASIYI
jgi:hypothetical protein